MDTLANRNNNPGNLKDPNTGNFRTFQSPQEGFAALMNDLQAKKTGTTTTGVGPSSSLADFAKVYAPPSENDSAQYTANLANFMGVRPDAKLSTLDVGKWADAVARAEGYKSQQPSQPSVNQTQPQSPQPQHTDLKSAIQAFKNKQQVVQTEKQDDSSLYGALQPKEGEGLFKKLSKGLGRGIIDITRPVGTLLARPVQVGQALAGQTVEEQADVPLLSRIYGKIEAPETATDVRKDVGRGLQTAALGLAPVAGGALYGAGTGVERGSSAAGIAGEAVLGGTLGKVAGVVAPKVASMVGKGIPEFAKAALTGALAKVGSKIDEGMSAVPSPFGGKIQKVASWLDEQPGRIWQATYGKGTVNDISKALGVTAKEVKSAGVLKNFDQRRKEGMEILASMGDDFKVRGVSGDEAVYRPYDPETTFAQHADALAQAKKEIWNALDGVSKTAGERGVVVDLSSTIQNLRKVSQSKTRATEVASRAQSLADQLEDISNSGSNTPAGIQEFLTDINAGLRGVFSGGSASRAAQIDAEVAKTISDALDSAVDKAPGGKAMEFLRRKYSALKSIEEGLVRQARQQSSRLGQGVQDYINPFNLADIFTAIAEPVQGIKGLLRYSLGKAVTGGKDRNAIFNKILENLAKSKGIYEKSAMSLSERTAPLIGGQTAGLLTGILQDRQ